MKQWLRLGLVGCLVLSLGACSFLSNISEDGAGETTAADTTQITAEPVSGGESLLTVTMDSDNYGSSAFGGFGGSEAPAAWAAAEAVLAQDKRPSCKDWQSKTTGDSCCPRLCVSV